MITLVERIATAMFKVDNRPGVDWDDAKDWEKEEYRAMARIALNTIKNVLDEEIARI